MARACANCGTEVDDDALFCPTCGEPIERGAEPDLPPAPDWPSATPVAASGSGAESQVSDYAQARVDQRGAAAGDDTRATSAVDRDAAEPPPAEPEPARPAPPAANGEADVPPWRRGAAYRSATPSPAAASGPIPPGPGALRPEGVIRPPTTLSGWLIGGGALVGVIGMLLPWVISGSYTGGWGLASGVNLLFTLVLLAVLVVVFLPHLVPDVPQRNLVLLAIALIGVGMGLDRLGLPLTGSGAMIFLIGMLASAAGAFLAQLGLDRAVGGQLS
jgi:hypothetical protein